MKLELFPFQQRVLDQTEDQNRVAYYLDMGLGKTFVGSEKLKQLDRDFNLVVCQKSKIPDWMEHFETYYPEIPVNDYTKKGASIKPGITVVNYDLTFRRSELLDMKHLTLMLDESSLIQNETTQRAKFALQCAADNVILLSGTPTAGKYENLWSQIHLLGWGISKDLYWKHYIETEWVEDEEFGFMRKVVTGYKNVDRLKQKLRDHGAVFLKSDEVFDLPRQVPIKVRVDVSKEYKRFMKKHLVTIQGKELVGDTSLTKRLYARMLCGHYNKQKLAAFKDLIESTEDRLVVYYNWNDELDELIKLVGDSKPVSIVNGSMKNLNAFEWYDNSITFIQYQAGAMGLNLQKANKVVYFTLPQSSELFEQSKKRIHRIGQEQRCFYYFLMCRDSVEDDILQTLHERKDYTDELFRTYQNSI